MFSLLRTIRRTYIPTSVYKKTQDPVVFLEVAGPSVSGRIKIRLYENEHPEASENFRKMCQGFTDASGKKVSYKGVKFTNLMRNFFMETQDISQTAFGGPILHESHDLKFDKAGLVGLSYDVKSGKEESGSGFFITLAPLPNLEKHVIVGEVAEGMDVLQVGDDRGEIMEIKNCGFDGYVKFANAHDDHHDGHHGDHHDEHHDGHHDAHKDGHHDAPQHGHEAKGKEHHGHH